MTTEGQAIKAIREFIDVFGITQERLPQRMEISIHDNDSGIPIVEWIYQDYALEQYNALAILWQIAHGGR